jgi:hypothetical protein
MAKRTTDTPSQPSPSTTSSSRGWPTKPRLATTSTRSIARRGKRGRPQARSAPPTIESVRVDPRTQAAPRTLGRGRGTRCFRDNPRSAPTAPRSELTTTPERRLRERSWLVLHDEEEQPWPRSTRHRRRSSLLGTTSPSMTSSSPLLRSGLATAAARWTPIATTCARSSSGRPTCSSLCWRPRVRTSSCSEPGWRSGA